MTRIRIDAVLALEVVELVLALRIHDAALGLPRSAPVRAPLPLHAVQEGRQRRLLLLLLGFRLFAPLLLLRLGFDGLLLLRRGRRPLPLEHELRERLGVVASELLELGRVDIARLEREQNLLNLVLVLLRLVPVVARFERRGLASLHQVAHVVVGGHVLVFSGVSGGFTPRRSLAGHDLDRDGFDKLSSLKLRGEPLGVFRCHPVSLQVPLNRDLGPEQRGVLHRVVVTGGVAVFEGVVLPLGVVELEGEVDVPGAGARGGLHVDVGGVVDESVADDLARLLGLGLVAVRRVGGVLDVVGIGRVVLGVHVRARVVGVLVVPRVSAPLRLHLGPALGTLELARLGRLLSGWRVAVDVHGVIRRRGRIGGGLGYDGVSLGGARPRDLFCGIGHVRPGGALRRARGCELAGDLFVGRDARRGGAALVGARRGGVRAHRIPRTKRRRSPWVRACGSVMTSVVSSFKPRNSNWCFGHAGTLVSKQCLLCPTILP